jgi:hypothetical protein
MAQVVREDDHGHDRPREQRQAASQRDDAVMHSAPAWPVDSADASSEPRRRPVQQERDCEPERERCEGELRAVVHVEPW